jgi:hypothetical protein
MPKKGRRSFDDGSANSIDGIIQRLHRRCCFIDIEFSRLAKPVQSQSAITFDASTISITKAQKVACP